jgi:hypothetical protein
MSTYINEGNADSKSSSDYIVHSIFSLAIFLIYTITAVIVTKKVKYKFPLKVYVNIFAFVLSMAINMVFGLITLIYPENFMKYVHIPQTIEEFVLIYTFYGLLYEMRITYLKIVCDDHNLYHQRKRRQKKAWIVIYLALLLILSTDLCIKIFFLEEA